MALLLLMPGIVAIASACGAEETPTATIVRATMPVPTLTEPSAEAAVTARSTAAPTSTPVATLAALEREARVRAVLKDNGGCVLPCFWGIAPGAASAEEARTVLYGLGGQELSDDETDTAGQRTTGLLVDGIPTGIRTIEQDGVITAIDVYAESYENPFALQTAWEIYTLSSILTTYGAPSRGFLEAVIEEVSDPEARRYGLWLYYDDLGFAMRYGGSATVIEDVVRICPGWAGPGGMAAIRFLLQSPGSGRPLEALTGYTQEQLQYVWPLELASGLTTEEFHNLYMQGDELECFEMPIARPE